VTDHLTQTVPVWWVTWGTCAALIPAETRRDAEAIARQRDRELTPGRVPQRINSRPAVERDRERFALWNEIKAP
jgi:hypothetical protein